MTRGCVLLKHGEVTLKGRNRRRFEERLRRNLQDAVAGLGTDRVRVTTRGGVTVLSGDVPVGELVESARCVIGFDVVQPALTVPKTPEDVASAAVDLVRDRLTGPGGFAVRARRRDKTFPLRSEELAGLVGARVQAELGVPVDLRHPALELAVEVDRDEVFLSTERIPGQGGLPVGTSGRAVALLSGGYDSPVAAYRAMRRGLHCDLVHFTGAPYTGPSSAYKAYALARMLSRYQPETRLHIVPLGGAQRSLAAAGAGRFQIVAQRRLMGRVAAELGYRTRARALVTGDSLGQVASQTLSNLAAFDEAVPLPVLRPLLGWDKKEIMSEASRIGTDVVSRLPDEDCCRQFVPPRVATATNRQQITRLERRTDVEHTVQELLGRVQTLSLGEDDAPDLGAADPTPDPAPAPAVADAQDGPLTDGR